MGRILDIEKIDYNHIDTTYYTPEENLLNETRPMEESAIQF